MYVSSDELLAFEQARLTLRARHGMAVDRGRIVREAIAGALADLDSQRRRAPSWSAGWLGRDASPDEPDDDREPDARREAVPGPLDNFEGPFDLLLQLISRHKLDITEVALSKVTDDFIGHIKAAGAAWDLDQTSEFLVVAATLLDLKAARLLPSGEVDDPEDLALLEARDLLFARLLQYRAFKQVAAWLAGSWTQAPPVPPRGRRWSRGSPGCCPRSSRSARSGSPRSRRRRWPRSRPTGLAGPPARPAGQRPRAGGLMVDRLRRAAYADLPRADRRRARPGHQVARFLALLELFREGAVTFDQLTPLGELTVRWTGADDGELDISDEFDEPPATRRRTRRSDPTTEPAVEAEPTVDRPTSPARSRRCCCWPRSRCSETGWPQAVERAAGGRRALAELAASTTRPAAASSCASSPAAGGTTPAPSTPT